MTRRTFCSSSIRSVLVCRRPAVSAMTTSKPSATPRLTASKITDDGSAPSLPRTSVAPTRLAQISSCSVAAARKVSPAASSTFLPVGDELGGQLADGGGLAAAVDADHQQHERAAGAEVDRRRVQRQDLRAALAQVRPDRVGVRQLLARQRRAELLQQLLAGAHADVGGEQDLLDVVDDADGSSSLRPAKTSPRRETQPDRVRARPGASAAASFLGRGGGRTAGGGGLSARTDAGARRRRSGLRAGVGAPGWRRGDGR